MGHKSKSDWSCAQKSVASPLLGAAPPSIESKNRKNATPRATRAFAASRGSARGSAAHRCGEAHPSRGRLQHDDPSRPPRPPELRQREEDEHDTLGLLRSGRMEAT